MNTRHKALVLLIFGAPTLGALAMVGPQNSKAKEVDVQVATTQIKERKAHAELGSVLWQRGFDESLEKSRSEKKPLFVLFDEVPGCQTVQGYSDAVLNHPVIVDVLEQHFVPLYVQNNAGAGADDTRVLKSFNEPAWNNPVARVIGAEGESQARLSDDYSLLGTARFLRSSLEKSQKAVPDYLQLLIEEEENKSKTLSRVRLSMYCFWTGEVAIGQIPGVASTKPGHLGGKEVVEVFYDSSRLSLSELLKGAKKNGLQFAVFADDKDQLEQAQGAGFSASINAKKMRDAPGDDKYQLTHSRYKALKMSELQRMKLNAALHTEKNPLRWLSPSQRDAVTH